MSRNEMQWEMPAATDTPGRYLGMSPRGGKLAAVSALELNAYDAHTGRHLKQLRLSNSQGDRITPEFAAFSADEKRMVVVSDFVGGQFDLASMVLVDTETWSRIAQFEYLRTALHESFIGAAASDDLSTIAALSISAPKGNGAIIRVWQPNKGNAKVLACGDELPIRILHMSPDGQQLLASGLGPAFAFRLSDGEPIWSWPNWDHFDQCPDGLDFDKCTITCPIGPIKQEAEQEPTKRKRD